MARTASKASKGDMALDPVMRRVAWRLMPLLVACFIISFIDRQNVGFAKLTMLEATGMSEAVFALGASLFFIGYLVFEIPSSLGLHRFGARAWITRIMLTWGAATVLLGFTANATMFYVLRFLLGAAEAGFYPGALFYLTLWFPKAYRTRVLGVFTLGSALGNMLGAGLSGPLLDLGGLLGLQGWQWVFLGTGIPALLMAIAVAVWLPSSPQNAKFLSEAEKSALAAALARDREQSQPASGNPFLCLLDPRVFGFAALYMLMSTAQYGLTYWMPTLVKGFGVSATANGLLTMIPWGLAAAMLLIVPGRVKGDTTVFRVVSLIALTGMLSFLASIFLPHNGLRFLALCIGAPCISLMYPFFWTFPSRLFAGARAAASLAAINSIGNLGGFIGQNLMPHVKAWTGTTVGPMFVPAGCLALVFVVAVTASFIARSAGHLARESARHGG